MSEAMMQNSIWDKFKDDISRVVRAPAVYLAFARDLHGYIVMEIVEGVVPCEDSDVELVAAAVQALVDISIRPGKPGNLGDDLIRHPFYVDWEAPREYRTLEHLQNHVNGVSVSLSFTSS